MMINKKEIAQNLVCVQMRAGMQIWIEANRAQTLQSILENLSEHKFIRFDEQTINTADIVGVFTAQTMDMHTRRKNGEWQCNYGEWHERFEKCSCNVQVPEYAKTWQKYYQ